MEYHTQFQYRGVESFTFTGDDDVYFFVNNILFVDLGGVHGALTASRSLNNPQIALQQFGMSIGGVYNFDFFFCERHTTASNLRMATNILLNDCPFLDACGLCTQSAPTSTVNPCTTMQCGNGVCSCPNASCVCNSGWTNGPNGNCSQNCGNGIIEGDEQCDPPGACCTDTCKFAALGSSCPAQGRPCVQNICPGNSRTCGVALPIGSLCTGVGTAPQCKQYQCTAADGSACTLVNNNTLTCSDNNACTTDTCVNGVCTQQALTCPSTECRNPGTCNAGTGSCSQGTPFADGTGCGADPGLAICVRPTCVGGTCTNTNKPNNTPCGGPNNVACGTSVCIDGVCSEVPIADAQGKVAGCPPAAAGSCVRQVCSGIGCATVPIADYSTCSNASLTPNSCQRLGCLSGVCQLISINEGSNCVDGGALTAYGNDTCSKKICQSGACVVLPDASLDTTPCTLSSSGPNPEPYCRRYECSTGICVARNVNESLPCTAPPVPTTLCERQSCSAGVCTTVPTNFNGRCEPDLNDGCTLRRCNTTGGCSNEFTPAGVSCNTSNLCAPAFCDGFGACVPVPVVCNPTLCENTYSCRATSGKCEGDPGTNCCGDGVVIAGEECDDPSNPCCVNCQWANTNDDCGSTDCVQRRCTPAPSPPDAMQCTSTPLSGNTCTGPAPPNQCEENRCVSGVCRNVSKADTMPCTVATGFCAMSQCFGGVCEVVPNTARAGVNCSDAYGSVPECNTASCTGTQCVLEDANNGQPCTGLEDGDCRSPVCADGSCVYSFTAFPSGTPCAEISSTTTCLVPGCDGNGNCVLQNAPQGVACDIPSNPECNVPRCDGNGECVLEPINLNDTCTAVHDLQCQVSRCSAAGNCDVSNLPDGTNCSRTDAGQCQDAECQGGACVLINTAATDRLCTPTPDPTEDRSCMLFYCQPSGSCDVPTPRPDNTPCSDFNLCDADLCQSGTCAHTPSVECNTPSLPCESPLGTCNSAFGNCSYTGRGQYANCVPRDSELDPRCNASVAGAYRCATGAPDSACVPSCFAGGVCGDGIVQADEQCDWGDPRTGGPCCNITCRWFEELAPCNNTDPVAVANINAQAANLSASSDLPVYCFVQRCTMQSSQSVCTLGLDTTVSTKCAPTDRGTNNRTAVLASVIPGALVAILLAAAGFILWRRAQKAAENEWLQEYLNSGNVRVENNAAFVETQHSVNSAAFQPDGK